MKQNIADYSFLLVLVWMVLMKTAHSVDVPEDPEATTEESYLQQKRRYYGSQFRSNPHYLGMNFGKRATDSPPSLTENNFEMDSQESRDKRYYTDMLHQIYVDDLLSSLDADQWRKRGRNHYYKRDNAAENPIDNGLPYMERRRFTFGKRFGLKDSGENIGDMDKRRMTFGRRLLATNEANTYEYPYKRRMTFAKRSGSVHNNLTAVQRKNRDTSTVSVTPLSLSEYFKKRIMTFGKRAPLPSFYVDDTIPSDTDKYTDLDKRRMTFGKRQNEQVEKRRMMTFGKRYLPNDPSSSYVNVDEDATENDMDKRRMTFGTREYDGANCYDFDEFSKRRMTFGKREPYDDNSDVTKRRMTFGKRDQYLNEHMNVDAGTMALDSSQTHAEEDINDEKRRMTFWKREPVKLDEDKRRMTFGKRNPFESELVENDKRRIIFGKREMTNERQLTYENPLGMNSTMSSENAWSSEQLEDAILEEDKRRMTFGKRESLDNYIFENQNVDMDNDKRKILFGKRVNFNDENMESMKRKMKFGKKDETSILEEDKRGMTFGKKDYSNWFAPETDKRARMTFGKRDASLDYPFPEEEKRRMRLTFGKRFDEWDYGEDNNMDFNDTRTEIKFG